MNKFFYSAMVAASLLTLSACGSDDDTPAGTSGTTEKTQVIGTTNVFAEGLPRVSPNYQKIELDDKGRVTRIEADNDETILFEYLNATRAAQQFDVIITIMDDGKLDSKLKCVLNDDGFVTNVVQEYARSKADDTWAFEYTDKYMTKMTRSEGGNEVTNITYNNEHDIIKVTVDDDDNYRHEITISYTDSIVKTALPNKGCIMLHDSTFDIDLDEMCWAYIAGLLGKATTHLPVDYILTEDKSTSYSYFKWTLNSDNLPVKMEEYESDGRLDKTWTWTW